MTGRINPLNFFFYLLSRNIPYGCTKKIIHRNIHKKYSIRRFPCRVMSTKYSIDLYINIIHHDYSI